MRGFWHLVDAVLASIILLGFVVVMGQNIAVMPQEEPLNYLAFEELMELDEQGILRDHAIAMDYAGLNSHVTLYVYNHSIEICDSSDNCVGERPEDKNVWVGTYVISGKDAYDPHTVKLYVW